MKLLLLKEWAPNDLQLEHREQANTLKIRQKKQAKQQQTNGQSSAEKKQEEQKNRLAEIDAGEVWDASQQLGQRAVSKEGKDQQRPQTQGRRGKDKIERPLFLSHNGRGLEAEAEAGWERKTPIEGRDWLAEREKEMGGTVNDGDMVAGIAVGDVALTRGCHSKRKRSKARTCAKSEE